MFGFQSATTMASSPPLPQLPVSCYHGFQSASSGQPLPWLPVSYYHAFQAAATTASSQLLPWLPVSRRHGFQAATNMPAAVLIMLCCLASCSPKTQRCQQLHHLLPFDSNIFQVLRVSCICAGLA